MENLEINNYIREIVSYSSKINKYVNDEEPWTKVKNSDDRVGAILCVALNALKNIFVLLHPIMPEKSENFLSCLGIVPENISLKLINQNIDSNITLIMPGLLFKKQI
jgi:methionyl-tRNA synthetase